MAVDLIHRKSVTAKDVFAIRLFHSLFVVALVLLTDAFFLSFPKEESCNQTYI